jgi:hypothetical protein
MFTLTDVHDVRIANGDNLGTTNICSSIRGLIKSALPHSVAPGCL